MDRRRLRAEISRTDELDYLIFTPARIPEPWPLLLFLHGSGERGDDLDLVTVHGPPKLAAEGGELPYLLVAPQCPAESWWTWHQDALIALLDEVEAEFPVDPSRIYLTGLSMGGIGSWELAIRHPGRFAALVPICGASQPWLARRLRDVPVRAFHNAHDESVPARGTSDMVAAVQQAGGQAEATIYDARGHDAWTNAYQDPELTRWLLAQRRTG
ncbi:alpha/beta hydrolase-fold protein [Microlunatus sp. GCM10028923]|uniref:carboxylesterase family protein n=1 Tax=Microlunatus sp. GCM10028923 TaxID=3273400 RepID=UPI00360DBAFB